MRISYWSSDVCPSDLTIAASDKVLLYDTTACGCPDPAGLTYDPSSGRLLLVDSEVDESPFFSETNMFALDTEGSFLQGFSLTGFSEEATGVAYWRDPSTSEESLFITEDEEQAVCRVSLDNPGIKLAEFSSRRAEEHTLEIQSIMRTAYAAYG